MWNGFIIPSIYGYERIRNRFHKNSPPNIRGYTDIFTVYVSSDSDAVWQVNGVDVAAAKHDEVADLIKKAGQFLSLTVISVHDDTTSSQRHGN